MNRFRTVPVELRSSRTPLSDEGYAHSRTISWASGLIICAAVLVSWREFYHLATSSLWQDELHSVVHYSTKGILYTATHYTEPNNHIFFNLLNALIPGDLRFVPICARCWSFFFVIATLLLTIAYQFRRGRLFDGALQGYLLLGNIGMLDLLLQARGYSITAFGALCSTFLIYEYFRNPTLWPLTGLAITAWLATWSVPTFVLFAGPLFLVFLLFNRDWKWLVSGCVAGLLVLLSYFPVAGELIRSSKTFAAQWGKAFATWDAINQLFSTYLFFDVTVWVTFLAAILVVIVFLSDLVLTDPAERACYCVGVATAIALAAALKLETPFPRTLAYLVIPFAFVIVTTISRYLRRLSGKNQAYAVWGIAAVVIAVATYQTSVFSFEPIEAWRETARVVEARFPKGTTIVAPFRSQWLGVYLDNGYQFTSYFDESAFLQGKEIVVDSAFIPKERFAVTRLPAGYATVKVPQRRGQYQLVYYWPRP